MLARLKAHPKKTALSFVAALLVFLTGIGAIDSTTAGNIGKVVGVVFSVIPEDRPAPPPVVLPAVTVKSEPVGWASTATVPVTSTDSITPTTRSTQ